MERKVQNFEGFINEAKLNRKTASARSVNYQDLFRLPEYQEVLQVGLVLNPTEDAAFRGTGMITFKMPYNSVHITDTNLLNRALEDEAEGEAGKGCLLDVVVDKNRSMYVNGILSPRTQRFKCKPLETLADYAYNFKLVVLAIKHINKNSEGWHLTTINSDDDRDNNRIDSLISGAIDDLW